MSSYVFNPVGNLNAACGLSLKQLLPKTVQRVATVTMRQLYLENQSRAYVSDVFIVIWVGNLIIDVDCSSPVHFP